MLNLTSITTIQGEIVEIGIIDYSNNEYTVTVDFNVKVGVYVSLDFSLSDLAVLKEIVNNAKEELEKRIAEESGNQATRQ